MTFISALVAGRARPTSGRRAVMTLLALALAVTACGSAPATFDPAGPCVADGRQASAYPDLEARLPADLNGSPPTMVDSGRNCTEGALGSLVAHDIDAVAFAGATWDLGNGWGVSSVIFARPAPDAGVLPAAWVAEFYEVGARTAKRTDNVEASRETFDGAGETWRVDALNSLSLQTVVTWQDGDLVRAVLVATTVSPGASRDAHDSLVAAAVKAAVDAPQGGG